MVKTMRATSVLLLCFYLALLLAGCGGTSTSSSNPGNPGTGNNPGGNNGGNGGGAPNSASETLYESFTDFSKTAGRGVRAFRIDPNNGTLSALTGFPMNGQFTAIFADPAGRLLFSSGIVQGPTNFTVDTAAFQINTSTAAITQSADTPGTGGNMVFHPNNKFVYFLDGSRLVGFAFDAAGHLSPLPGSPYSTNLEWADLAPNGRFLYAATGNDVIGFSVDANSGALTMLPGMPLTVRSFTDGCCSKLYQGLVVKFSADSQTLFIGDEGNGALSSYSVNQSSGAITKVMSVPDRQGNIRMVITPNNRFLYESASGGFCCEIRGFVIGPGGTLAPMPSGFAVPVQPETFINTDIFLDPGGRFLYQANNSGTFSGYVIDQNTGNLSPNGQVITDTVPVGVAIVR